jgi:hypothetical protein
MVFSQESAMQRPKKAKKKHHLRENTDPVLVESVNKNEWGDAFGGRHEDGKDYIDPRLHGKKERR